MLNLKSIRLYNFVSHADTKLSLDPNTAYAINGVNGVGKTLLFDGLTWSLYGKTLRDFPIDVLLGKFDKNSFVTTVWKNKKDSYRITRSATNTWSAFLEIISSSLLRLCSDSKD